MDTPDLVSQQPEALLQSQNEGADKNGLNTNDFRRPAPRSNDAYARLRGEFGMPDGLVTARS
jgi:hypothetical protein